LTECLNSSGKRADRVVQVEACLPGKRAVAFLKSISGSDLSLRLPEGRDAIEEGRWQVRKSSCHQ
jgi:hypothetical protein